MRKPRTATARHRDPPRPGRAGALADALAAHASTIRTAVATLALTPPDVLPAASVTGRLAGGLEEARRLRALSRELATGAGLVAEVRIDGALFHVRLRRSPTVAPRAPRSTDGWLGRLMRRWQPAGRLLRRRSGRSNPCG